ncbi:unnamed protein product, partial [Agarophyton chilense]
AARPAYLRAALAATAAADPFTARLLALLRDEEEHNDGDVEDHHDRHRRVRLSICRYDYFMHVDAAGCYALRMVELNCIAASYACLGTRVAAMHRFLAEHPAATPAAPRRLPPYRLPRDAPDAAVALPDALAAAHAAFVRESAPPPHAPVVLVMVVQPDERNAADQNQLRHALWHRHRVEMLRLSLTQLASCAALDERSHLTLRLRARPAPLVVSVVYFRAGYAPKDYPSAAEWRAREMLERSTAANCPSVAVQLVGTKKLQQLLDRPDELERFLPTAAAADVRATFARQYSLDEREDEVQARRAVHDAVHNEMHYVLKPQREGGGNNLYASDMKNALLRMSAHERSAFVLMDRITPPQFDNVTVRDGVCTCEQVVSELGVYGVHISVGDDEVHNDLAGTLLRSKPAAKDDGGVSAGVALLDSVLLFDDDAGDGDDAN